jgi:hypothetical protein
MARLKTQTTDASVTAFLNRIEDKAKRDDALVIAEMMESVTKIKPAMYGSSIVGFGSDHYKYESGHEGDAPIVAFSPRKANVVLYLALGSGVGTELLESLGKHKTGKGCLYLNKLADVDLKVLQKLVKVSFDYMKKTYLSK